MSEGADISTVQAIVIALAGGLLGSVLGVAGSFALTWRADGRQRRARLRAMENELLSNLAVIEHRAVGDQPPVKLSDAMWERLRVDLALDIAESTYSDLQTLYELLTRAETATTEVLHGRGNSGDVEDARFWADLCIRCNLRVKRELRGSLRIKDRAGLIWNSVKRHIPGREKKETQS